MNSKERQNVVESIFAEIVAQNAEERIAYLKVRCAELGDEVRDEVENLLAANDAVTKAKLFKPVVGLVDLVSSTVDRRMVELETDSIGPYRLVQKIGEGGMGIVYLAEQKEPVRRRVALKLIKPGIDSKVVCARFEAERQALAMMDHPCVAKVFDAGATESARPYFVMELVKGLPITEYCEGKHSTVKQRLELFLRVTDAVQHAHQKGIIHRDLKPQNILVGEYDQKPVPKVIDFGIAKAINQKLTERTVFTQVGQILGTFEYMSPEQAQVNELDIDTRSDVYSLGVILYELLTGVTPFERKRLYTAGLEEMLRIIKEEEPPKPSTRNSTASRRRTDLVASRRLRSPNLPSQVDGDLDWIVMMALEKDRNLRYESVKAFGDDLRRYLMDEAIVARPPSLVYRFTKFARRNRMALSAVLTVVVLVCLFCITVGYQAALASAVTLSIFFGVLGLVVGGVVVRKNSEIIAQRRASEAVSDLLTAREFNVLEKVQGLRYVPFARELLQKHAKQRPENADDRKVLNAQIALAATDDVCIPTLVESLLNESSASYVGVIRQTLRPHKYAIADELWSVLHGTGERIGRRFRAGIALADYAADSRKWKDDDYRLLAEHLLSERPEEQAVWREHLYSIGKRCVPHWERLFSDHAASMPIILNSAYALEAFAGDDYQRMPRLLATANPSQYEILFPIVDGSTDEELINGLRTLSSTLPSETLSSERRVSFGRQRAGAGITLLRLGYHQEALKALEHTDDPEALTQFIHGCRLRGVAAAEILECYDFCNERKFLENDHLRFALILALGEYKLTELPQRERGRLLDDLSDLYRSDPSSAIHGATGWLLRAWDRDDVVNAVDQTPLPYSVDREWFTVKVRAQPSGEAFHFTFVVFKPGSYAVGSWHDEPERSDMERRHEVRITRPFALLDRQVTFEELIACNASHEKTMRMFTASPGTAGPGIMWYDSVHLCRWMTMHSGMAEQDQVYPAMAPQDEEHCERERFVKSAPREWEVHFERRGFRLPTEAEWEIASRAGTSTRFGHGGDERLLGHYAWYAENSQKRVHPPKERRPNPRGLFDIHGNLFEWCHDWAGPYPQDLETDPTGPRNGPGRILRGGCWGVLSAFCRSSNRINMPPSTNFIFEGIRVCLTLPETEHHLFCNSSAIARPNTSPTSM